LSSRQKELLDLLDKSGADLYALLTRLTLREDVAEELMQELFIKLNNSRGAGNAVNLNAYARKSAINLAFDWRRSQKRTVTATGQFSDKEGIPRSACHAIPSAGILR